MTSRRNDPLSLSLFLSKRRKKEEDEILRNLQFFHSPLKKLYYISRFETSSAQTKVEVFVADCREGGSKAAA